MSRSEQQVIILAGGLGTRLRPVTEKIPKCLVEVSGRPYLEWQFDYLQTSGFRKVLMLCSHLGEQVESHFGEKYGNLDISYSFERPEPMGTGGALKNALPKIQNIFWLVNGDSFLKVDFDKMYLEFSKYDALVTAFRDLDNTRVKANLKISKVTGASAVVNGYQRDGGPENGCNAVDSGVYLIKKSVVEKGPTGRFQVEDLWPALIAEKRLGAYFENEKFYDIGTPERLKTFEEFARDHL